MKTFELTFAVTTQDGSDIDLAQLERDLAPYGNTDLEFLDMELVEPAEVHVTFSVRANSISECPDYLELLNDEDFVDDIELYDSERVSYTSY